MSLVIRLQPTGRKKVKTYRIVVQEKRSKLQGNAVAIIGHYNAQTHPVSVEIDREKAKKWISQGAQPSKMIAILLEKDNFIYTKGFQPDKPVIKPMNKKAKARVVVEKEAAAKVVEEAEKAKEDAKKAKEEAEKVKEEVTGTEESATTDIPPTTE